MSDFGVVRCSICFFDYKNGDRLKQYPCCEHVFHIRCLDLWLSFEARCPNCLKFYPGEQAIEGSSDVDQERPNAQN